MDIKLTKDQYENLIKLVYLGNWMINGIRLHDEQVEKYEKIEQYIFSFAKDAEMEKYIEYDGKSKKFFPTGEFEIHINFTTNIGLGGSGGSIWSLGFASDGSYGASTSWQAGGFAGGDVSVGAGIGYSNAKTWNNTQGKNNYVGAGGKLILGADAGLNFSKDGKLNGADISGGIGLSSPLYMKGGMGETTILMSRSIKQDVQNIGKGISNAVGSVKEGVGKVINKLIK